MVYICHVYDFFCWIPAILYPLQLSIDPSLSRLIIFAFKFHFDTFIHCFHQRNPLFQSLSLIILRIKPILWQILLGLIICYTKGTLEVHGLIGVTQANRMVDIYRIVNWGKHRHSDWKNIGTVISFHMFLCHTN